MSALLRGCTWSMQHLISHCSEEDVENDTSIEDLLHRNQQGIDARSPAFDRRYGNNELQ